MILGLELSATAGVTAAQLVGSATEEGLLLVPAGPTVVRFVPPLVVTEADVANALLALEKALLKHVKI